MRNMKTAVSAAVMAALLLTACGKAPAPAESGAPDTGSTAAAPTAGTETSVPAGDGLLRTAVLYDITTMDVAKTTDNYLIPMNVFDRLFETRPGENGAEVVKSLCEDYQVSEDGLTYDFTL
ncbi:MAG TPA: hypothetical protein DCG70_01210, partial [Lachnoclostridium sp.]|nr:hypothetical protein [Lachnoclostridium sp.]